MTRISLVMGFQAALDPDLISMKPCSSLVADELSMGAIPTSMYSSLDVAVRFVSVDLEATPGPLQLMKRFSGDRYEDGSIYNLVCSLLCTVQPLLLSWLLPLSGSRVH